MRYLVLLLLLVLVCSCSSLTCAAALGKFELLPYNPVANGGAVFVQGQARFTFLTARLVRIEYSLSSLPKFEDRATMAIVNRALPAPQVAKTMNGSTLTLESSSVRLTYAGGPFTSSSLQVVSSSSSSFQSWQFGQSNSGNENLLGTIKSLDNLGVVSLNCTQNADVRVHNESLHCAWAVISRRGWATYDDSENWALSADAEFWQSPNVDSVDLYLFAHGSAYKDALADFVSVAGRVAMTPRAAMGIWFTRWFNFASSDVRRVVDAYESRSMPLDVWISDMNFHDKFAWGGYTVDNRLYSTDDVRDWLAQRSLVLGVNLHDDTGMMCTERTYAQFAEALGLDPTSTQTIPFSATNQSYLYALDDIVLPAVLGNGVSCQWIDWQQGGIVGGAKGGAQNPTIILNKLRSTDHLRRGESARGMVLGRFGGVGSHRYQVGFSGDVAGLTWKNLAFQPYFSLTASNVAYGWWSHDLVGPNENMELYTRWLQWGAYSAVFRSHDRGMSSGPCAYAGVCAVVRPYNVPLRYFEANRAAMRGRRELLPYIYTAMRQAFDSGLSILRPMYYESPSADASYAAATPSGSMAQYYFGDDMIVAPVVAPADESGTAAKSIWLPPASAWYEEATGALIEVAATSANGATVTRRYDVAEVPVFVRAGAVVGRRPICGQLDLIGGASAPYSALEFVVYPGTSSGQTTVYEDDGQTTAYVGGDYALTLGQYSRQSPTTLTFTAHTSGSYAGMPLTRYIELRVLSTMPPTSVLVNGAPAAYSRYERRRCGLGGGGGAAAASSTSATWRYDGAHAAIVVSMPNVASGGSHKLTVSIGTAPEVPGLDGLRGGIAHATLAKQALDFPQLTEGVHSTTGGYVSVAANFGDQLEALVARQNASAFGALLSSFWPIVFDGALAEMAGQANYSQGSLLQLWDQQRLDSALCMNAQCVLDNDYYEHVRVEGAMPPSGTPNTVALNLYWNPTSQDNLVTTATQAPPGYQDAQFSDGAVFASQQPDTVPLSVYYHPVRQDHVTVASQQGHHFATYWGYELVNATIGYVYPSSSSSSSSSAAMADPINASNVVTYATTLLQNVFPSSTIVN
jgi:alpha-glucosidase (family GH31 glycosyl hydrolase)